MVENIARGFRDLMEYAHVVEGNPAKTEAIRAQQERVTQFLAEQGLSEVRKPAVQIAEASGRQAAEKYRAWQNHISAVAQEALHVEGEEFVHSTQASVVRALRAKARQGLEPRLISTYSDSTLANQIFWSGLRLTDLIHHSGKTYEGGLQDIRRPVAELVADEDFISRFPYKGWLDTMRTVSETLPFNLTPTDLRNILRSFTKWVGLDLRQFRSVQQRLVRVRLLTSGTAA